MRINRNIESVIRDHLKLPEITLIVGPRQVGKTTLIEGLGRELEAAGSKKFSINLDIQDHFELLSSQSRFVDRLRLEFGDEKGFVFIDEVQRKEDAGRFFKGIYDMGLGYKFILTGSGSVELKEKVSESLAGRKQMFEVSPVTFDEFVNFKTGYKYDTNLGEFIDSGDASIRRFMAEYMQFGGYPRVVLADTLARKRIEMQEIYTSYLEKDITQLLQIRKTEAFNKLVTVLSSQIGQGANVNELSRTLGLDVATLNRYLWYLEKTYIITSCRPYYTNARSELTKTPLYYFVDLGMRNYALNRLSHFDLTLEGGHLFENMTLNHLYVKYSHLNPTINYWRTKDGSEVDFIFRLGSEILPIELKHAELKKSAVRRSLHNFIAKYDSKKAYVVNLTLNENVESENTTILFRTFPKFVTENISP